MQIGEVAERTGLSLRTIRYYEEVGLVVPSARSQGGFRLYTQADVDRLTLTRSMKPLGLHLEQMRELLAILDPTPDSPAVADPDARLTEFAELAERRCEEMRTQLHRVEEFTTMLRVRLRAARREEPENAPARSAARR